MKKLYLILVAAMLTSLIFSCAQQPESGNVANQASYNNVLSVKIEKQPEEKITPIVCIHDNDSSFHRCQIVYDYLEQESRLEEFHKWSENVTTKSLEENDPECTYVLYNIYDCLKYFDVPRDFFEYYYTSYAYVSNDFDIDLLYNGTREEVFKYYYDLDARYITFHKKESDQLLKVHMIAVMDMFDKFSTAVNSFSIPEFIYETGMTKEQFYLAKERVIKYQPVTNVVYDYSREELFYDYNIDDVFKNREFYEALIGKVKPYYIDDMIRS